jgi:hypothetical protein
MSYREIYLTVADMFADLVARLPAAGWDAPGLGDWSRRDLVGHTVSSGIRQVPHVLGNPAGEVAAATPESYWAIAWAAPAEVIANAIAASSEDARKSGIALGEDPADAVRHLVGAAAAALAEAGDDDVVRTAVGGMRVADWLPTRTFELAVHGIDVAASAELAFPLPAEVLADVAAHAARIAVAIGDGPALLRALTGRGTLPADYSIVGLANTRESRPT